MILGSEGNYGLVTQAILKIKKVAEVTKFGSIIFPSFDHGSHFMEEAYKSGPCPSSMRLVDNMQFKFGQSLKFGQSRLQKLVGEI